MKRRMVEVGNEIFVMGKFSLEEMRMELSDFP